MIRFESGRAHSLLAKGLVQLAKKGGNGGGSSRDEEKRVLLLEAIKHLKKAEDDFSVIGVHHRAKDCVYIRV